MTHFGRDIPAFAAWAVTALASAGAAAQPPNQVPHEMQGVGIVEHLNERLPLDVVFTDEDGNAVTLGDCFAGGKPVILTLNYFRCPSLCTQQLNGLLKALKDVDFTAGDEFRIVTVSFDPAEDPELARMKKNSHVAAYGREGAASEGWDFLTGSESNIRALTEAVGFTYKWDERRREWAHQAAIFVATPDGRLSRYLYSTTFEPDTIRLALLEASEGKIGSTIDRFIIWCFHYDNLTGRYTVAVMNIMRLAGGLTLAVLATGLAVLWRRDAARRAHDAAVARLAGIHST